MDSIIESPSFDISKEDQRYIRRICNNNNLNSSDKLDVLTNQFNLDNSTMTDMINFLGMSLSQSQFSAAKSHILKKKQRYIISSAQTASSVNDNLLNNMKAYAEFIDAEIGIIATRYRNPTSIWKEEGDIWDNKVLPYLTANRQELHKHVVLLADLKIQATAPNPTNGIELFGGEASVIVGSPRIEMRSVPILPTQEQKFLYSTGTVTNINFTDTVAGGKAAEHHSFGFVVVEIESDDVVHIRSISADDEGNFNDLIYRVENQNITSENVECLVWGDSHFAQKDVKVTEAFRKLSKDLGITTSILHDIYDSQSLNVHNAKNGVEQHRLMIEGKDDLSKELDQMYSELDWFETNMKNTIVVASNHDDMVDRTLYLGDWRDNLKNAKLFVEMLHITLSGKAPNGIIPYFINSKYSNITALGVDSSYIKYGVELGIHGHKGPNGSKGNILAFSKLATKTITGHSHSPYIRWGCYQVGVSCALQHGYNKGLSGWAYASCTLNKYGKRQLIILNKNTLTYTTLY